MKYEMLCQSPFPMVRLQLARGEKILIEPGSMTYCDATIEFESKVNRGEGGGLFSAIGRAFTSGQSFFITHVTTEADNAYITLGAKQPGEVHELCLGQEQWVLQDGVFLVCDDGVNYKMVRQSRTLSEMFLSASVNHFMMETTGTGSMLIASCGKMREIELNGETIIVDNTHAVAWTTGLTFKPRILWAEVGAGFIYEFSGYGKVLVQSCCRVSPGK